jgi:hypothetical protein
MKFEYKNPQEYQQQLFEEFENFSAQQFEKLIVATKYLISVIEGDVLTYQEEEQLEFIKSIKNYCEENRTMSFKQWKALRAFIKKHKTNQTTKQF